MKLSIVWIDREHAKIFHFSDEKMERKKLSASHIDHHSHKRDAIDQSQEEKKLFLEALKELTDSMRILIIGPGVAKHHFRAFLTEHHPMVAKNISGMETVDHPSDGQIAALAKKHFQKASA